MRKNPSLSLLSVLTLAALAPVAVAGCATTGPMVAAGPAASAVTVEVRNDAEHRPGEVRLASADYTLDGVPLISMRPANAETPDVAAAGRWSGNIAPGEHVLEATLAYPPRGDTGTEMAFTVREQFHFRSVRGDVVRIQVDEAVKDVGFTASLDQRLGVAFKVQ